MANTIKIKRGSGSDPAASDMVLGEPVLRTDTAELFFKKDDGSVAKVSGGGGGPDFKYLALRNAANNGAASYPNADFTLVTSGTTNAITVAAANTLLVSVNGVIQKPNTGTSTPSSGFALSGTTIKFGGNISAAPDFILYQESGGIGEPSDETVSEAKLQVSNSPVNGYFLSAQSGNTGGLTWAAPVATSCTGNSATATALATARAINGVNFDGTSAITVTAAAGTLSGNTLNSSVTASSLTSLGDLAGLTVNGDATFTGANYNVLWDKSDNALEFAANAKAVFASDLTISHTGDHGNIVNTDGNLNIKSQGRISLFPADNNDGIIIINGGGVELYHSNNKKFETDSNGVTVTGQLRFTDDNSIIVRPTSSSLAFNTGGSERLRINSSGHVKLPDNKQLQFGGALNSGNGDLRIYHSGSHSFVQDVGTGSLKLAGADVHIVNADNTAVLAQFISGGKNELRHDNSPKLETTSSGVTVTGTVTATSFSGDGSNLTGISAGATGGGSDEIFYENSQTITTDYTITSNKNAMSAGPITINNGVSVTVPSGSTYTIV